MKNISKKNFSFFVNKPFTIFEIDNFLPEEELLNLLRFIHLSLILRQR